MKVNYKKVGNLELLLHFNEEMARVNIETKNMTVKDFHDVDKYFYLSLITALIFMLFNYLFLSRFEYEYYYPTITSTICFGGSYFLYHVATKTEQYEQVFKDFFLEFSVYYANSIVFILGGAYSVFALSIEADIFYDDIAHTAFNIVYSLYLIGLSLYYFGNKAHFIEIKEDKEAFYSKKIIMERLIFKRNTNEELIKYAYEYKLDEFIKTYYERLGLTKKDFRHARNHRTKYYDSGFNAKIRAVKKLKENKVAKKKEANNERK